MASSPAVTKAAPPAGAAEKGTTRLDTLRMLKADDSRKQHLIQSLMKTNATLQMEISVTLRGGGDTPLTFSFGAGAPGSASAAASAGEASATGTVHQLLERVVAARQAAAAAAVATDSSAPASGTATTLPPGLASHLVAFTREAQSQASEAAGEDLLGSAGTPSLPGASAAVTLAA